MYIMKRILILTRFEYADKFGGLLIMKEIDEVLKKVKRVHFIGIGGSGMCPLVEILHSKDMK